MLEFNPGQIIEIGAGSDFEIIWGDIEEVPDPYTGKTILELGSDAQTSTTGTAFVEIEDADETLVYFRINKFFPPKVADKESGVLDSLLPDLLNPCECLNITKDEPKILISLMKLKFLVTLM